MLKTELWRALTDKLARAYPEPEDVGRVLAGLEYKDLEWFGRLWVAEGIPYVFRRQPLAYEHIREFLARRLGIHPKVITLVGSARLGFSLAPRSFGEPFDPGKSDLDLLAVSEALFAVVTTEFRRWRDDYMKEKVRPSNPNEQRYWKDNASEVPAQISRGFIDCNRIPRRASYPWAQYIGESLFRTTLEYKRQTGVVAQANLRIYRDWPAFSKQLRKNLETLRDNLRRRSSDIAASAKEVASAHE